MLKHSKFYQLALSLGRVFSDAYTYSGTVKAYRLFLRKLTGIWKKSFLYSMLNVFFREDGTWRETFFYKLFTNPAKWLINYLIKKYSRPLNAAVKRSTAGNWLRENEASLKEYWIYYIGIIIACLFGVYTLGAFVLYNLHGMQLFKYMIATALGVLITLAGSLKNINKAAQNSLLVRFLKEFWENAD